jgi:hypothetical protein
MIIEYVFHGDFCALLSKQTVYDSWDAHAKKKAKVVRELYYV